MLQQQIQLYPDRGDVSLTTYVWNDSSEMLNGGLRPAVLVCPGGAYLMCSDREAEPVALAYAAMGYHAFVLRYSTFFGNTVDPDRKENPDCVTPQPMLDIAAALLTMEAHASEWLVDMEQIALCGFSAGGHNCAMYAVNWNNKAFVQASSKPWIKPAACILGYPVIDMEQAVNGQMLETLNPDEPDLAKMFLQAYFGTEHPTAQQLEQNSPHKLVSGDTPPTFLWATAEDKTVPVNNTLQYAAALSNAKVPFELHVFEEGGHGLSTATRASSHRGRFLNKDAAKWLPLSAAWLEKRFHLPLGE